MSAAPVPALTAAGFLFDLEGVLVDSTANVERHWRHLAAQHDLDPTALLADVLGRRAADVIRDLAPRLRAPLEQVIGEFEVHEVADQDGATALPGAISTLQELPLGSWAVVTRGHRQGR